jgi:hypothetical protein
MAIEIEIVLIAGVVAIGLIVLGRAIGTGLLSPPISPPGAANRRVAGAASGRCSATRVN